MRRVFSVFIKVLLIAVVAWVAAVAGIWLVYWLAVAVGIEPFATFRVTASNITAMTFVFIVFSLSVRRGVIKRKRGHALKRSLLGQIVGSVSWLAFAYVIGPEEVKTDLDYALQQVVFGQWLGGAVHSGIALGRDQKKHPRNACRNCGYLLIGLTVPRCPECGTPFSPLALTPSAAQLPPVPPLRNSPPSGKDNM